MLVVSDCRQNLKIPLSGVLLEYFSNIITEEVFHNLLCIKEILGVEADPMKQTRETPFHAAPFQIGFQG